MQVDIGNDKIHNNFTGIVSSREVKQLQRTLEDQQQSDSRKLQRRRQGNDKDSQTVTSDHSSEFSDLKDNQKPHRLPRRSSSSAPNATPTPQSRIPRSAPVSKEARRPSTSQRRPSSLVAMSNSNRGVTANGYTRPRPDSGAIVENKNENGGGASEEKENRKKDDPAVPKPAPKLAQTKIRPGMRLKRWMVLNRIGAGSFGETFTAIEVDEILPPLDPEEDPLTITADAQAIVDNPPDPTLCVEVCIKVEQENKDVLRIEALALKKVQPCLQVVRYLGSGCTCGMNFLVMEKLGPNLAELRRRSPHGTFNIYTTLKAGMSCLQAIRGVHEQGLVHRDIKPSNFVTGLFGSSDQATCFIIDFGLARRYRRSNGEIRAPRENAGFRGTSRYASVTSHHHQELGRVDDLWSLLFMLVEFATGTLPWRKYKDKDEIGRCKEESINPHLVRNLPREFQPFLAHLQTLRYEDEPDYDLLVSLMQRSLERRGYPPDKPVDWELDPSMIEAADGEMMSQQQQQQQVQQVQPSRSSVVSGRSGAVESSVPNIVSPGFGGSHLPGRPSPRPSGADSASKAPDLRVSASVPGKAALGHSQQQLSSKVVSSESSEAEPRPAPSGTALRVSEVDILYQRSIQNEESRSNLGISTHKAPPPTNGGKAPSSGGGGGGKPAHGADAEYDDGREFSPREGEDGDSVGPHAPPAEHREAVPAAASKDGETKSKTPAAVMSPSVPRPSDSIRSLDAIEQNAVNNPPPPPAQGPRVTPNDAAAANKAKSEEKGGKTKSKCNCAIM